jgi:hypothetical protein
MLAAKVERVIAARAGIDFSFSYTSRFCQAGRHGDGTKDYNPPRAHAHARALRRDI